MRKQLQLFEIQKFATPVALFPRQHRPRAPIPKPCGTVGTYQPRGSAHGDRKYFRFSYRDGNRMKHRHIPGGNVDNSVARQRAEAVRQAIARGANVEEVLQLIKKSSS